MLRQLFVVLGGVVFLFVSTERLPAQASATTADTSSVTNTAPAPPAAATNAAPSGDAASKALPVNAAAANENATLSANDFVIGGVCYARVLYMDGNVWIKSPDKSGFRPLTADELIPAQSVLATGPLGTLDFATGPGMAIRVLPATAVIVDELPLPSSVKSQSDVPETTQVILKKGSIFSALGREDNHPIDYKVRTPQGVATARGGLFAVSLTEGQAQVDMLHGTVIFEAPNYQKSQVIAGQSQQITTSPGGKYQLGRHRGLNPDSSVVFFNRAGGLLEHASGYGVVRRGLGADVVKSLRDRGYKMPSEARQRFLNAGATHYKSRPGVGHANEPQPNSTDHKGNTP